MRFFIGVMILVFITMIGFGFLVDIYETHFKGGVDQPCFRNGTCEKGLTCAL